jgi:hypothetical protein
MVIVPVVSLNPSPHTNPNARKYDMKIIRNLMLQLSALILSI